MRQLPAHLVLRCLIHCPMGLTCCTSFACTHAELKVLTESYSSLHKYIHVCVCAQQKKPSNQKQETCPRMCVCVCISIIQISTRVGYGPFCSFLMSDGLFGVVCSFRPQNICIFQHLPTITDTHKSIQL